MVYGMNFRAAFTTLQRTMPLSIIFCYAVFHIILCLLERVSALSLLQHQAAILWKFSFHLLHINFGISNYSHYFIFSVRFSLHLVVEWLPVVGSGQLITAIKGKRTWLQLTTGHL